MIGPFDVHLLSTFYLKLILHDCDVNVSTGKLYG